MDDNENKMYKLMTKQGEVVTCVAKKDDRMEIESIHQAFLNFAEQSDWKVTTLNNGKNQLKRGKEVFQQWVEDANGEVAR
jgi:hypothetical protein